MKKLIYLILLVHFVTVSAQIGLPVQNSLLPKNSLVVDYDFSKPISYTRGSTSVNNMTGNGSGAATLVQSPNFMNSLGFLSFNGTNQYLVSPNLRSYFKSVNSSIQKSFTMSLWVYPTKSNGVIVSELDSQTPSGGWHASNIEIVNNTIYYRIWSGTAISSLSSVSLNQWYHLAMVYDGVRLKAYLNGVLQGTQTNDRELPTFGQYYTLAASEITHMGSGGVNGGFNCAQFKLFQLPLTDSDILQEYNLRKDEFDYTLHSPSTNTNPTYWSVSSSWVNDGFNGGASYPHYSPWLNSYQGWSAGANDTNQFVILNYDEPVTMKGIVTQGRSNGAQWVSSAHIDVSLNGTTWTRVVSNATLNSNYTEDARVLFPTSVLAKYIRVSPVTWSGHITMRLGVIVEPKPIVTNGLVLRLDAANLKSYPGTGTTWSDLSGNGNNGILTNGPIFNSDNGGHIIMDGVNDYVNEPTLPSVSGNNSRTVMAWYKSTANRNTVILDKGSVLDDGAEQLFVAYANSVGTTGAYPPTNPGGIVVAFWGNDLYYPISSSTLFDGNWHFVAYTYDNSNSSVRICFDGTFATSVYQWNLSWTINNSSPFILPNSINTANNPLLIGQNRGALWGSGGLYSNVGIPYVNIFNRALSESEILTNYNATRSRYGR